MYYFDLDGREIESTSTLSVGTQTCTLPKLTSCTYTQTHVTMEAFDELIDAKKELHRIQLF